MENSFFTLQFCYCDGYVSYDLIATERNTSVSTESWSFFLDIISNVS